MTAAIVALLVSIGTSVFWAGWFFGVLKGKLDRTRQHLRDHGQRIKELEAFMRRSQVRSRDIEKSLSAVARRPFLPRYPEDQIPLPGEVTYTATAGEQEPELKKIITP